MALEATHIRFALDVQGIFAPADIGKYVAGAVYPDSRYVTGVDRRRTHDDSQMKQDFWRGDDFRKGWATHLLYDKIQFSIHTDWFADILQIGNPDMTDEQEWVVRSALKTLQDIDDVQHFDIDPYLSGLIYVETPNDEDPSMMRAYNKLFIDLYSQAPNITIENLWQMWSGLHIDVRLAKLIRDKAYAFQNEKNIYQSVMNMYDESLGRVQKYCNDYFFE